MMLLNPSKHTPEWRRIVLRTLPVVAFFVVTAILMTALHFYQAWEVNRHMSPLSISSSNNQKVGAIHKEFVYDLSGSEASGYSDPMRLFDEDCDPKNGRDGTPVTDPLPSRNPHLYFPQGKGLRIVIDLRATYSVTDIYLYDRSFESDSVWVYTGDMSNWIQQAAYRTGGSPHSWGWKNYTANTRSRYIMIRFNSRRAAISELVLYGVPLQKVQPPPESSYQGKLLPRPTLREFMGTNSYDLPTLAVMRPFHKTRLYQYLSWYDNDTSHAYPNNKLTLNYFNLPDSQQLRYYVDSLTRKFGNEMWLSIRGVPLNMEKKGVNEKDKPVTQPGMDMEDPLSYARHAKTFWNLAALFGSTKVDTNLVDVSDVPKFSGARLMNLFENGNEEDAYWINTYWSPAEYFAMSSADYDGHEGKLGRKHGIKNADPHSRLMMSGMIQLDTNRLKVLSFLCKTLRRDGKFIWEGGVQYHHYSNDAKDNTKPPTTGITPEMDSMRKKLARVREFQYRLVPTVPAILGENGYDRMQTSWQKCPVLRGYNEEQSQGILIIRSMIAAFMAGFDGYNQFMLRNATNDERAPGTFATSGLIGGPSSSRIYQGWYYWSTVVNLLGSYQPDAVITESGKVWVYKLRHKTIKDSVAYYMVCPTQNGSVVKNFKLATRFKNPQVVKEVRLTDNNVYGTTRLAKRDEGIIELAVGESPVFVLCKEN